MANIFFGLNVGRSALLAHQAAIDVTGHNLANVQTEGYSRQRVSMVQNLPIDTPQGPIGSGVNMDRVQRIQAAYLERQINLVQSQHGYDDALVRGLEQVQSVLGEPSSSGLGSALTEFWNSWDALSARPGDAALRAQVLDRAEHLATTYNEKIAALKEVEREFNTAVADDLSEVNSWTEKLASLNASIGKSESAGYTANDLRDQRDLLVQQIAEKIGLETETDGPYVNLRFTDNGPYLVYRGTVTGDVIGNTDSTGKITTFQVGTAPVVPSGGDIGALLQLRDRVSGGLRDELGSLMATVADAVNGLHTSGYDKEGDPGLNFFTWGGEGGHVAFAASSGMQQVTADPLLQAGTHFLKITQMDSSLAGSGGGNVSSTAGTISFSATSVVPYSGPQTINLEYRVEVLSSNTTAGSLDGLRVQLYRGDEAIDDPVDISDASPTHTWSGIDGFDFSASFDATAASTTFGKGDRSDGLATTGKVSLDGGPAEAVGFSVANHIAFDAGSVGGYVGGSMTVDFTMGAFSGGSVTVYGPDATLSVNPNVAVNSGKIAAAERPAGGTAATGNGEIARRIASLATDPIFEDVQETPAGMLGVAVASLGNKVRDANILEKASGTILLQLQGQRESTSGVNMDEEMVQLIQFQRGFEAAARFVSTVDGLIETLINRVGAGR